MRRQRAADARQVVLAGRAQAHAMRAALEQAHAQMRFEPRDLVADRGSREVQFRGRQRKAAAPRHGLEGLQVREAEERWPWVNPHVR